MYVHVKLYAKYFLELHVRGGYGRSGLNIIWICMCFVDLFYYCFRSKSMNERNCRPIERNLFWNRILEEWGINFKWWCTFDSDEAELLLNLHLQPTYKTVASLFTAQWHFCAPSFFVIRLEERLLKMSGII